MDLPPGAVLGHGRALLLALLLASSGGLAAALKVAAPYSLYVCPEGQNVTMSCKVTGSLADRHDSLFKTWHMGRAESRSCSEKGAIRNVSERELHPHHGGHRAANGSQGPGEPAPRRGVELASDHHGNFSLTLLNLTARDGGLYCCLVMDFNHRHLEQTAHGLMELRVQSGQAPLSKCTLHPASIQESETSPWLPCWSGKGKLGRRVLSEARHPPREGLSEEGAGAAREATAVGSDITAAALATGACIVGILCLPLILLLVYKQQQAASNRRALELVRMESNAQGIENPVFEAVSPGASESKPKPPLSYMAQRQPSESGRHLLSEPNTPLSPPGIGDVFFPSLDPVPDSPDSEAV
ncbi:V-type immunoglobulin domain-containing suppressor of T-cell activation isoform 1-T1 [Sarcophilus harrisii]